MASDEFPTPRTNVKIIVLTEYGTHLIGDTTDPTLSGTAVLSLSGGALQFTGSAGTITQLAVA